MSDTWYFHDGKAAPRPPDAPRGGHLRHVARVALAARAPGRALWLLGVVCQFAFAATPAHAEQEPRRVLLLSPYNISFTSDVISGEALRRHLQQRIPASNLAFFLDFLDLGRFSGAEHETRTARYLAEKYADARPHVVVALSPLALSFALKHRERIAPGAPIVFGSISAATLASLNPPKDATGITNEFELGKALLLARQLQPTARDVVVVSGASEFDRRWAQTARRQLAPYEREYSIRHLAGLERGALLDAVRKLDRNTIVLLTVTYMDGAGRTLVPVEFATELAAASNAPVYGPFDSYIGRGIVGGFVESYDDTGVATAEVVLQLLAGANPEAVPPRPSKRGVNKVDARQLARWGLSAANVPPGTTVLFAQPTLWEEHRGVVLAIAAAFAIQTSLLVYLLVQIRRRRQAERSLEQSEQRVAVAAGKLRSMEHQYQSVLDEIGERLVALQEEERRRIAAELHDSTGQHLVAGGLFLVQLRSLVGDVAGSADVMDQIQTTLREAQKEIRIFTYLLYPPDLRRVGLKETVERFVEGFARRTGIRLRIEVAGSADGAPYELQRSILRIVQEALSNVHRHAQATSVAVTLTSKPDRIQLRVADNGRGFAKANGGPVNPGVGLPGMEARIRQFRGDLKVYSGKRGTLVVATVPIAQRSAVSSPPLSAARSNDLVPAPALSLSDAVAPRRGYLTPAVPGLRYSNDTLNARGR